MQDTKLTQTHATGPAPATTLSLTVNGEPRRTDAPTLSGLLVSLGYGGARIATAVNGEFVPERLRAARPLSEGDAVEIVAPRQGG